jgi:linoleate 10R-lipoxygenase
VQDLVQRNDDAGLHAYVVEAQRITSSQRNVRVATAAGELDGKPIKPGNVVVMLLVSVISVLTQLLFITNSLTMWTG